MNKCCSDKPEWKIVYDAGLETSEWLLCKTHYDSDPVFQKHIKTIQKVDVK